MAILHANSYVTFAEHASSVHMITVHAFVLSWSNPGIDVRLKVPLDAAAYLGRMMILLPSAANAKSAAEPSMF